MSPPDPFPTSALLAESAWLKRLALRLVSEDSGAEDAAQETLAKALVHPPPSAVPLRRWLAAVLRNVVRQERRTSARREVRELARPPLADAEPADALAERLELHEKLVAAVRGLSEPYRTTVALRFLEDLTPPAVAARMGVPLKTVHTRLERALAQLRERLDREHGGRETWLRVFLPLVPVRPPLELSGPASATPLLAPLLAMSTLWKWTAGCAAVAALGFLGLRALDAAPPRAARAPTPDVRTGAAELAAPPLSEVAPAPRIEREAVGSAPGPRATPPASGAESVAAPLLAGFVRDLERRPVAGLTVAYQPIASTPTRPTAPESAAASAESASDGRFELPLVEGPVRIVAHGRGLATVIAPVVAGPPPPEPPLVIVGPERSYAGQVVDEAGAPIAGAELALTLERTLARELAPGVFAGTIPLATGSSDADGRFALPPVGGAPGSQLAARAPGFQSAQLALPEESSDALLVRLAPATRAPETLAGRVLRADGTPAEGAYVSGGGTAVRSREDGTFELELEAGEPPERVRAVLPGCLPAERALDDLAPGAELVLVLGGAPLAIEGRVLDGAGQPVAGARVWTQDGERFGQVSRQLGEVSFYLTFELESVIAGAEVPQLDGRRSRAADDGSFALTSLLERRYALYVLHPRTFELAGPLEVRAGSAGVVLTLPGEPARRVAGRVTSLGGEPLAGARVRVERAGRSADGQPLQLGGEADGPRGAPGKGELQRVTDAEGRFAFEELCTSGTRLLVSTDASPNSTPFALAGQPDLEDLRLALAAACHLRVFLADAADANYLELLDERGESLFVSFQLGGVTCSSAGVQIDGGVSDLLLTDERARTLVLRKDIAEVARVPLHLVPGQVNEIRP